jgi:hypothetical protein
MPYANYWPLDDGDPAPGDPSSLHGYAAALLSRAAALDHISGQTTATASASLSTWIGAAANSFRGAASNATCRIVTTSSVFTDVADTVSTFADELEAVQTDLASAALAARKAITARERAVTSLDTLLPGDPSRGMVHQLIAEADYDHRQAATRFGYAVNRLNSAALVCSRRVEASVLTLPPPSEDRPVCGPSALPARGTVAVPPDSPDHRAARLVMTDGWLFPDLSDLPALADVTQQALGDCWLLAVMAAMTQSDEGRKKLMQLVRKNVDGTYTVTFADKSAITVTGELYVNEGGYILYANGRTLPDETMALATWVQIIEKAYAARKTSGFGSLEGGDQLPALELLGGYKTKKLDLNPRFRRDPSDEHVKEVINTQLDKGRPVTASSDLGDEFHAWTVYDADDEFVYVRNPWGTDPSDAKEADRIATSLDLKNPVDTYLVPGVAGGLKIPIAEFTNGFNNLEYAA